MQSVVFSSTQLLTTSPPFCPSARFQTRPSNYTGQYISFLNTSDEIIHDITLSNKVDGNRVSVVVVSTIQSHKSTIFHGNALIKALKKLGLKDDGSGVIGSGMTITCKYHSKPTPVIGWWESNFNKWLKYELTSKKTGRKHVVEFEKEPTNEDIDHALERLDSESAR